MAPVRQCQDGIFCLECELSHSLRPISPLLLPLAECVSLERAQTALRCRAHKQMEHDMTSLPKHLEISPEDLDKISGGFFFLLALAAVALAGCGSCVSPCPPTPPSTPENA